jgi:hypothetical protein
MGTTATTADRRIGLTLRANEVLAGRGVNPRIRFDSLHLIRMVSEFVHRQYDCGATARQMTRLPDSSRKINH